MCRKIEEGDGLVALRNKRARWSESLERIVQPHHLFHGELGERVRSKYLCQGAKSHERILRRNLMRIGCGFAVSAKDGLVALNDNEHHSRGSGLHEEISAEGIHRLETRERCCGRCLSEGGIGAEYKHESEEDMQES